MSLLRRDGVGTTLGLPPRPSPARWDIQAWRRRVVQWGMRLLGPGSVRKPEFAASIPQHGIHRVLVCRPNHRLGNLVMLTPLLIELMRTYPGTQVDLLVAGDQGVDLFRAFANVGTVFHLPRHAFRHPLRFFAVVRRVRRERYDLAIDPDLQSQSGRYLVARCRTTHRIGFCGPKTANGLSLAMPAPSVQRHMGQLPVCLLRWSMGDFSEHAEAGMPGLDLQLSIAEREWGRCRLAELVGRDSTAKPAGVVAIFTDATAGKRHPSAWWLELLSALRRHYPDRDFVEILPAHGLSGLADSTPAYFSSAPRRLAAVLAATRLFLTADCGVMHLACAARGPAVVGLFRCTDPAVYGPYGEGNAALSTNGLDPATLLRRIAQIHPG